MQKLSEEQLELARLIADGLTYEEIGVRLKMNPRTVKTRSDELRRIFGVRKKRQLGPLMRKLGLI